MAVDQQEQLQHAERLLKQGKVEDALRQLRMLAKRAPNDMLTLNRVGDLLARRGRAEEAIRYYAQTGDQFAAGGYHSKAIAIYKKILRLDSGRTEAR